VANQARLEAWFKTQWQNIETHRVTRRAWRFRKSYALQEIDWGLRQEAMSRVAGAHERAEKAKTDRKNKGPVDDEEK